MSRFRLIQPYLEERRSLILVASDANLPFRTAQRWVSQYGKFGLAAFVRKARDDRGARRVVSPMIEAAIEGLALERPPLPVRSICRQVRAFAEATGEPMPGYGTVYDLVREVPSDLLTLAHEGSKAYSEGYDLVHRREAARSNAIWQADHAQLGILLIREDGQTSRPWLTIVIDDYSRAVAGYYLGFDPPSSMRTCPRSWARSLWVARPRQH
jgi:putative transposase